MGTLLKRFFLFLVACVLSFIVIEGLCSAVLLPWDLLSQHGVAERLHGKYDAELGWVNIPNLSVKDFYGPGINFKTNSRGFRNNEEFTTPVPANKVRVICSGDSFTLGPGVDDDHLWPQLLESLDERFQTVNMGQAGYGVDQMYLWYQRDGRPLEHNIHIFAPIWADFWRMQSTEHLGRGKPILRLRNGELAIDNVPVPRRSSLSLWLSQDLEAIKRLRVLELLGRVVRSISPKKKLSPPSDHQILPTTDREILAKMLTTLASTNSQKQSLLILVYLPTLEDYKPHERSSVYRQFLHEEAAKQGVLFFDLVDEFQRLPRQEMEKMFIPPGVQYYPAAYGHYSIEGNEYVAKQLYKRLVALPEVSKKLMLAGRSAQMRSHSLNASLR